MSSYAAGAAFIDGAGTVVAADPGFLSALGLPAADPTGALRALTEREPALRALLSGAGPDRARLSVPEGPLELLRHRAVGGALLLVRTPQLRERLEQGLRAAALSRLVAGMAHDIKNPLNAMSLQLALLAEKLSSHGASLPHLGSLREQIGRVNDVVRRFVDVTDPAAPFGHAELGTIVADAGALLGHEARRRRVQLVVQPPRGGARAAGDPARVGALVLVLMASTMADTPDGGRLEAEVGAEGGEVVLRLVHAVGDRQPETGYDGEVTAGAAVDLGGTLQEQREGGVARVVLRLPRSERP